jgi:dTDP-glucose pyrophosphorylase
LAEKPALMVLAAGMGSRFGGLKQMEGLGPSGEKILDYSIYDAARAGFGKIVIVIRKDLEADFRQLVGKPIEKRFEVSYAFQEIDALPKPFLPLSHRTKPWGTAHAILVGSKKIDGNFAVINADDFYGRASFEVLADYFLAPKHDDVSTVEFSMVGFELKNTLSENGFVSRGVCTLDQNDFLKSVREVSEIKEVGGVIEAPDKASGKTESLDSKTIVSMNLWGFSTAVKPILEKGFIDFLKKNSQTEKAEYQIPTVINEQLLSGKVRVKVLRSSDLWFGVTYREDKAAVQASLLKRIESGEYPRKLWD